MYGSQKARTASGLFEFLGACFQSFFVNVRVHMLENFQKYHFQKENSGKATRPIVGEVFTKPVFSSTEVQKRILTKRTHSASLRVGFDGMGWDGGIKCVL